MAAVWGYCLVGSVAELIALEVPGDHLELTDGAGFGVHLRGKWSTPFGSTFHNWSSFSCTRIRNEDLNSMSVEMESKSSSGWLIFLINELAGA